MLPPFLTGLFLPNLSSPNLEQLVVVRVQFKKTKRTEHIRQYAILVGLQGCATCYETVHRTVSSKFVFAKFGAACRGSSSIKKTKRTEHIRQYAILVGLQGCATCYETVHRTVSSKFVFAKFGAACRWFESINSERKADTLLRIGFSLAPQVGLEPTTLRLTAACSTN